MHLKTRYKLIIWLILFAIFVSLSVFTILNKYYILTTFCLCLVISMAYAIVKLYRKHILKINLIFESIDNDDYTFRLKDGQKDMDEDELLNYSLNRISKLVLNARKEVRISEKYFETILNQVNIGVMLINDLGIILKINDYALKLFSSTGISHINQLKKLFDDLPEIITNLTNGTNAQIKYYNESSLIRLSLNATELKIQGQQLKIITITDIFSEIDQAEIDSWNKMSRVFTHEIMNSLAPITAISESLSSSLDDKDFLKQGIDIINKTSLRLLSFVDSYRTLTKLAPANLEEVNLNDLLTTCCNLNYSKQKIKINISEGAHIVMADPDQITQVLINLIKNAIEASDDVWINLLYNADGHSIIEVCNGGELISDEIRENIFVPFFTTKTEGTGIGLSLSRQIMRQHQGSITLITRPYTNFKITF